MENRRGDIIIVDDISHQEVGRIPGNQVTHHYPYSNRNPYSSRQLKSVKSPPLPEVKFNQNKEEEGLDKLSAGGFRRKKFKTKRRKFSKSKHTRNSKSKRRYRKY